MQHVIWIVFENKGYDSIVGSPNAPYINSLAQQCGLATNFFAVAHPSLPNYIAMTSGSTQGITDDADPASHPLSVPSIFSQLGSDWKSLQESMPSNCSMTNSGDYAVRHNPPAYYTNVNCADQDVPLGPTPDLSARFTYVTPNLCNDMHDCSVGTGDTWLAGFMPKVLASPEYQAGGTAVFITWDESGGGSNHVATLVVSPYTTPGTEAATLYDHYSLLRTTEELLGLETLGNASTAPSMRGAFNLGHEDQLWVALVPAYRRCTAPNSTHGAPLEYPSCNPPSQTSGYLTVGTPEVNGQRANSVSYVRLYAVPDNPSTPVGGADVGITTALTDVRLSSDLSDYTGEVQTVLSVRLTALGTASGGDEPQTVEDFPFLVTVPCLATAETATGATCSLQTTANSIIPGAVTGANGSLWQLDKAQVYDGGADGLGSTTADNTLFETQGVFVP
jgi:phosphatidylinositol-3-phosphatase